MVVVVRIREGANERESLLEKGRIREGAYQVGGGVVVKIREGANERESSEKG